MTGSQWYGQFGDCNEILAASILQSRDVHKGLSQVKRLEDQKSVDASLYTPSGGLIFQIVTCSAIDIFANALELGCIVKVSRADSFADQIPIRSCWLYIDLLLLHDVEQLLPYFLCLSQHCKVLVLSQEQMRQACCCSLILCVWRLLLASSRAPCICGLGTAFHVTERFHTDFLNSTNLKSYKKLV